MGLERGVWFAPGGEHLLYLTLNATQVPGAAVSFHKVPTIHKWANQGDETDIGLISLIHSLVLMGHQYINVSIN